MQILEHGHEKKCRGRKQAARAKDLCGRIYYYLVDQSRNASGRQDCPANNPTSEESRFNVFIENEIKDQQDQESGHFKKRERNLSLTGDWGQQFLTELADA